MLNEYFFSKEEYKNKFIDKNDIDKIELIYNIEGGDFSNAGFASSNLKKYLKKLAIEPKILRRIAIASYEAEINVVAHAYMGEFISIITPKGILLAIIDKGPGIKDVEKAMEPGYSTASERVREMGFGAGFGLPNIQQNCDKFFLISEINKGTTLEIIIFFNNG